ncbi:MAG: beta-ketoacyl-ACP synthase II [Candidatus Omnitrophota bacterium]
MTERRVVITGLGAVTPIGNNVKDFWKSCIEGKGGVGPITGFDASIFRSRIAGEVKNLDPTSHIDPKELRRMDKFVHYAVIAAKEALLDSGIDLSKEDTNRIGVLIGSGIGSLQVIEDQYNILLAKGPNRMSPFLIPMLIVNMAPGQVAIQLGLHGPNSCTATACASGSHAIGDAFRIIQRGDADVMFCGGTESCVTRMGVGGFCAMHALSERNDDPAHASRPFDLERDGFVMAEGSGITMLEELEHAKRRQAKIYAEMAGYGMTGDAHHMTAPSPDGNGAARCMTNAVKDAKFNIADISYINAHGTSTKLNDKIETLAIKTVFGECAKKIPVNSTKSMTGHLLGAAGGVEFIVCTKSIQENIIHPTINYQYPDPECDLDYVPNTSRKVKVDVALSNSLGFGGHNATVVIKRFKG